jgi:tetratricopeptide (TPR) repeat protein
MLGLTRMAAGRARDAHRSFELAWRHGQRAGETRLALDAAGSQRVAMNIGPTPATDALRLFEEHAPAVTTPFHLARLEVAKAWALAMRGAFAESRSRLSSGRSLYRELGLPLEDAGSVQVLYLIEVMAGDAGAATEDLLATVRILDDLGETNLLGTIAGMSADALVTWDRCIHAEQLSRRAEELADAHDVDAQTRWRRARARILARRGEIVDAERFARAAVELVAGTDALNDHADALLDLSEVLRLAGRPEEASSSVRRAIVLYRRKGNVAMAARSRLLIGAGHEV